MDCPHCGTEFHDQWTQTASGKPMPDGKCWQMFVTVCQACQKETVEVQRFQLDDDGQWLRDGECMKVYPSLTSKPTPQSDPIGI